MKRFRIRYLGFLLASAAVFSAPAGAGRHDQWPLFGYRLVETHWQAWTENFFVYGRDQKLLALTSEKTSVKKRFEYRFDFHPDFIKHFPLEEGDLIVALSREEKMISFTGFDRSGREIYNKKFNLDYKLLSADVRINDNGTPVCLFYTQSRNNYTITLWENGNGRDLFVSEYPVQQMYLSYGQSTVHLLSRVGSQLNWITWKQGKIDRYRIPDLLRVTDFFIWQKSQYLLGIDIKGTLWRYAIGGGGISKVKIASDLQFRFVDSVIPTVYRKQLTLLLPASRQNAVTMITVEDLLANRARKPQRRNIFWASTIRPMVVAEQLYLLLETDLQHIYLEPWDKSPTPVNDFEWAISEKKKEVNLEISWKTPKGVKSPEYSYVLNRDNDISPVEDFRRLPKNQVSFRNPADGGYVFHLLVKEGEKKSGPFHIPIFWRYQPAMPEVLLDDEIAPGLVDQGELKFYIRNLEPVEYFAQINSTPNVEPVKKIDIRKSRVVMSGKLKPGRYYLHIRSRDSRSRVYSRTNHELFHVDPYNPEQDETLQENNQQLSELDFILRKIRDSRDNPDEQKKWIEKLQAIKAKMKN